MIMKLMRLRFYFVESSVEKNVNKGADVNHPALKVGVSRGDSDEFSILVMRWFAWRFFCDYDSIVVFYCVI